MLKGIMGKVREVIPDHENGRVTALMKGHGKRLEFSMDEVNAILIETDRNEIIRFDKGKAVNE